MNEGRLKEIEAVFDGTPLILELCAEVRRLRENGEKALVIMGVYVGEHSSCGKTHDRDCPMARLRSLLGKDPG